MAVSFNASLTANLGTISSGGSGSVVFNAGGADMLVVAVSWTYLPTLPYITFGGVALIPCLTPQPTASLGTAAIYYLPHPLTGNQTLLLSSPANYLGTVQVGLVGLSGTNGYLGARDGLIFTDSSPHTLTFSGTDSASSLVAFAFTEYGALTTLPPSGSWGTYYSNVGASNSSFVYGLVGAGGTQTLTVTPPAYANAFLVGIEVHASAFPPPSIPPTVVASKIADVEGLGFDPIPVAFDVNNAKMLLVGIAWPDTDNMPAISYGGIPLTYLRAPAISTPTVGEVAMAVLINPPTGAQVLEITGFSGYFGQTTVMFLGINGVSGVAGITASVFSGGEILQLSLPGAQANSMLVGFMAAEYARSAAVANEGWTQQQFLNGTYANGWIYTAAGSVGQIEVLQPTFSNTQLIVIEMQADIQVTPNYTGTLAARLPVLTESMSGTFTAKLTPNGQVYRAYLESFFEVPDWADPQPTDFALGNLPGSLDTVMFSFGIPQCTYVDLTSDIPSTTGLVWPGSAQLLRDTVSLLKARHPGVKVLMSVQQSTVTQYKPEPYDPTGWGGMTATHVANMKKFLEDMGMDGIDIDYECLSQNNALSYHCQNVGGVVSCYTDAELIRVIQLLRAGLPRPIILTYFAIHVGCYGEGIYADALPLGYNNGYCLALSRSTATVAMLDGIHVGTYDAGFTYDPRVAYEAFQYYFPSTPLYIGLRVGPPEADTTADNGPKRTLLQLTDYVNHSIVLNGAGAFLYACWWPIAQPTGNIQPDYPDSNMTTYMVTQRYDLSDAKTPLVGFNRRNGVTNQLI